MEQLIALIQKHGLWLVFGNVLVEQAGVPVPAYPTLIIAGAYLTVGEGRVLAQRKAQLPDGRPAHGVGRGDVQRDLERVPLVLREVHRRPGRLVRRVEQA